MLLISNSQSPIVKSKVQALESAFKETHNGDDLPVSQQSSHAASLANTSEMIKCLLWKTMQRGLRNRKAAPRLSPLNAEGIQPCTQGGDTLFAAMDECWEDIASDGDDYDCDLLDDEFDVTDPENDILIDVDVDVDADADEDPTNDTAHISLSPSSMIDSFSDAISESSLMLGEVEASPVPPPIPETLESVYRDAWATPQLPDSAMHSEMEMLDHSSPWGGHLASEPHCEDGDVDMLLF